MRALVTGAAGFIGSHLCERLLDEGHEVVGVDALTDYYSPRLKRANIAPCLERAGFTFHEQDLLQVDLERLLQGVDVVYHLAAQAGVRSSWGSEFEIYTTTNVLLTQRLLEAARAGELRRFVYASSSSVYGMVTSVPMEEDDPTRPHSPYGVTKLAGEHLARLYWRNFGVPTVSIRYFTVYGPRQRPDMAFHKFFRAIWFDRPVELYGDGLQTRDFTFIADIVEATYRAGLQGPPGSVMNVGGGHQITMNEVLELMRSITGRRVRVERVGAQPGDVRHTLASTARAAEHLGYAPRFRIEEGLRLEWEWMQNAIADGVIIQDR
jgi:UDP-glucose 4-epimerase